MREIKKLEEQDLRSFARILVNAYPVVHTDVDKTYNSFSKEFHEDDSIEFYGLFENDMLLGGMCFHHYHMNLYGKMISIAGVGSVAVDLLHKKEKVAKDLMTFFIEHFKKAGVHFLCLYPFRLEFYKKMGFGIGSKMNQYRIQPTSLPSGSSKSHLRYLTNEDQSLLKACHQRFVAETHGMFAKTDMELNGMFGNSNLRIIGYEQGNEIKGYLTFTFRRVTEDNFLKQNLHVIEIIYEHREVLSELLTFLQSQADQVDRIVVNTQDDYFHHLLSDPRNGTDRIIPSVFHESNTSGIGLMYRVTNVRGFLEDLSHRNFGGQTIRLKLTISDSFDHKNNMSFHVNFVNGSLIFDSSTEYDVEMKLDISDFSSMIMGVVPFKSLYKYGLIEVSDPMYIDVLDMLFKSNEKPICMSRF